MWNLKPTEKRKLCMVYSHGNGDLKFASRSEWHQVSSFHCSTYWS